MRGWFPGQVCHVYLDHKRAELAFLDKLDEAERCAAYQNAY